MILFEVLSPLASAMFRANWPTSLQTRGTNSFQEKKKRKQIKVSDFVLVTRRGLVEGDKLNNYARCDNV